MLSQNTRGDLVNLADQLEHGVIGKMTESKLALRHIAGIGLAEHRVAVAGHDLAGLQGGPQVVLDSRIAEVITNDPLHLLEPVQHFLVRPAFNIISHATANITRRGATYSP